MARLLACETPYSTFLVMLELGFWPIALYPQGVMIAGRRKIAEGKEPFGGRWGAERWTINRWDKAARRHSNLGIGICLGPGRGPGGAWLLDVEGDGPEAEESRVKLYGGEVVDSLRWGSVRGGHQLLIADVDRLAEIIPGLKDFEVKNPSSPGVYKPPSLPGLELRLGGYKGDESRTIKQIHSAIPPTLGTDGTPRAWVGGPEVVNAPERFYAGLAAMRKPKPAPASKAKPRPIAPAGGSADERWAAAALAQEWDELASCPEGGRNHRLNRAAFSLGQLVGGGYFTRGFIEAELRSAALKAKLDFAEIAETLKSGLEAGMAQPRVRPQRKQERVVPRLNVVRGDDDGPGDEAEAHPAPDDLPWFANYRRKDVEDEEGRKKSVVVPYHITGIASDLDALMPGWPKRVGKRLFVPTKDYEANYLTSASQLFAWIAPRCRIDWTKGARLTTQEWLFEHLRNCAERYSMVDTLPHTPPIEGTYYLHPPLPPPSGRLDELVDRFKADSDVDRELLKAMIITPAWGGPLGERPSFLITGPNFDERQGRGMGKSSLLDLIASDLYGGSIDVSQKDDMSDIKKRILSGEKLDARILRLDNIKTHKFSWAELESFITSRIISGHGMFVGECQRPNTFTRMITLNGATLSSDMAERVVMIRLGRATPRAKWKEETSAFIKANRWGILADAAQILAQPPGDMTPRVRWADWQSAVLSKMAIPERCQEAILQRQHMTNEGLSDRDIFLSFLRDQFAGENHDPDVSTLWVSSQDMAAMLSAAARDHYATNEGSAHIAGLGIVELHKKDLNKARGWLWSGSRSPTVEPTTFVYKPASRPAAGAGGRY